MNFGKLIEIGIVGTFVVLAIGMVLSNPAADQTILGGLGTDYVNGVKALK